MNGSETFGIHDAYVIAEAFIAVLLVVIGWMILQFMSIMRQFMKDMKVEVKKIEDSQRELQTEIYQDFVQKKDIAPVLSRIEQKLDKLYEMRSVNK